MKKLVASALVALSAAAATAGTTWLQYSIYSPGDLMLPWARGDVYGLRLTMPYGNNRGCLIGADLGFVGILSDRMSGCQLTCFNLVDAAPTRGFQFGAVANRTKEMYGLQLSGILNWNEDIAYGVQLAPVNFNGEFYGVQFSGISWLGNVSCGVTMAGFLMTRNEFQGFSLAGLNYGLQHVAGLQAGGANLSASTSCGLQLGVVNFAKHHEGVQIGLVNINGVGFLPCLPVVNFNFTR